MRHRLAFALAAGLLVAPLAAAADDTALLHVTTLNLSAEGEVDSVPDQATISFGVQTQAPTAAAAMRSNAQKMSAVIAAVKAAGVEARDIQTAALNLNAQYADRPNQPPLVSGYQATNSVSVIVHDLPRIGSTVDAVLAAGVNQINGVDFGIANPQPLQDEARRRAVKTLQTRAELYAGAAGLRLGRLINLSEGGGEPRPFMAKVSLRANAMQTPVEPGQLTVRIEVSAVYELVK